MIISCILAFLTWAGLLPSKVVVAVDALKFIFLKIFFQDNLKNKDNVCKSHQDACLQKLIFKNAVYFAGRATKKK